MPASITDAPRSLLFVAATAVEARAISQGLGAALAAIAPWRVLPIAPLADLLLTGVGKAHAAGALARGLDPSRHGAVVNLGVAGALPASAASTADLLDVVLASTSLLADEGLSAPGGFQSLAAMGFAPIGGGPASPSTRDPMGVAPSTGLAAALTPLASRVGVIATVSTCSGEDARARELARRTGAIAEAMEGAALAFTIHSLIQSGQAPASVGFAELRVISNTTGDRPSQRWRLDDALDRLATLAPAVRECVLAAGAADPSDA